MKICITAVGGSLDSAADPRFGRCQYFVIVDSDTMEFEAIENSAISASGGAGIQAAQSIANKGIEVLITGSVGPNAFPILTASDIKVVSVVKGSVADAIEQYKNGELQVLTGPTAPAHTGMGGNRGAGRGAGGGGRGRGGGQGMGGR